jgi:hypothetical protein
MSSSHVRPASSVKLNQGNDELKFIVSQIQMAVQVTSKRKSISFLSSFCDLF